MSIFLLITSGCVTQPPSNNVTSTLSDIFSAPIGGFVHPGISTIQKPDTTFESEYVFYSRNWGGEVKYSLFGRYKDHISNDSSGMFVEPSKFIAEPNHVYMSKVYLNSSTLPKDFFVPQPDWLNPNTSILNSPFFLYINVSLDGINSEFCNENILLQSFYDKPHFPVEYIEVENGSISLKKGKTRNFTFVYEPDLYASPGEISYSFSKTPLNVTIIPSRFIARHDFRYPIVVSLTADLDLVPGQYPVSFSQQGGVNEILISCNDCKAFDPRKKMFIINVTVE